MIQDLLKEHDNSRLSIRELQARIESTEPANKIVNDLILNILGSGEGL
jgi:hemerythrin-like domain-containing protein